MFTDERGLAPAHSDDEPDGEGKIGLLPKILDFLKLRIFAQSKVVLPQTFHGHVVVGHLTGDRDEVYIHRMSAGPS